MAEARQKQLRIKTGVVKRLVKEKASYQTEVGTGEAKVAEMKAGSADGYMVRKAEEILVESRAMVADCQRRLATAAAELQQLIQDGSEDLGESEEFKAATSVSNEAQAALA